MKLTNPTIAAAIGMAGVIIGCPATYQLELVNESKATVTVLAPHSGRLEDTIGPGQVKIIDFPPSCLVLQVADRRHQFPQTLPPDSSYVRVGVFSAVIAARFSEDGRLRIVKPGGQAKDEIAIAEGCTIHDDR